MKNLKRNQLGNISVEWVMVMVVVVLILFAPLPGTDQSLVGMMMQSIRGLNEHSSLIFSFP